LRKSCKRAPTVTNILDRRAGGDRLLDRKCLGTIGGGRTPSHAGAGLRSRKKKANVRHGGYVSPGMSGWRRSPGRCPSRLRAATGMWPKSYWGGLAALWRALLITLALARGAGSSPAAGVKRRKAIGKRK
jgi:hypothetical protein